MKYCIKSKVSLRYFVCDCIHFSQLLIVSIYQERIMTCPNMLHHGNIILTTCYFFVCFLLENIFSEIKQFFAQMKSKEIGISSDVKINLSIYVTEKKMFLSNLDKWWCVIISFKIGLKWNMILVFFGTITSALTELPE